MPSDEDDHWARIHLLFPCLLDASSFFLPKLRLQLQDKECREVAVALIHKYFPPSTTPIESEKEPLRAPVGTPFFGLERFVTVYAAALPVQAHLCSRALLCCYLPLCLDLLKRKQQLTREDSSLPSKNNTMKRLMVGISGAAGSGKSVFSAVLCECLNCVLPVGEGCCVVGLDGYHRYNDSLRTRDSKHLKGRPCTFDIEKLERDVEQLAKSAGKVRLPAYDRTIHDPVEDAIVVDEPPRCCIVLVEGILLLTQPFIDVSRHLHCSIFLDLDVDVAKERVNRRKMDGGVSHAETEAHYLRVDLPNHQDMKAACNADFTLVQDGTSFGYVLS